MYSVVIHLTSMSGVAVAFVGETRVVIPTEGCLFCRFINLPMPCLFSHRCSFPVQHSMMMMSAAWWCAFLPICFGSRRNRELWVVFLFNHSDQAIVFSCFLLSLRGEHPIPPWRLFFFFFFWGVLSRPMIVHKPCFVLYLEPSYSVPSLRRRLCCRCLVSLWWT